MTKNKKIISLILGILTLICLTLGIIGFSYTKEESLKEKNENKNEQSKDPYTLTIYKCKNGKLERPYTECGPKNPYKKIKTETTNAKVLTVSKNEKYILINDGNAKILNNETEELKEITLNPTYYEYNLLTYENKLIGITYKKEKLPSNENNTYSYYDLEKDKILYENTYPSIVLLNEHYLLGATLKNETYLLDTHEEKIITEINHLLEEKDGTEELKIYASEKDVITTIYNKENDVYKIYNIEEKEKLKNINKLSIKENLIYTIKDYKLTIYDFKFNKISEQKIDNYNIQLLLNEYGIYINNSTLNIIDLNTLNTKKIFDLNNEYTLANTYQGYKQTGFHENNKDKEGIYLYLTKVENKEENKFDTLDIEIQILEDLKINIFNLKGDRMLEKESGGTIS